MGDNNTNKNNMEPPRTLFSSSRISSSSKNRKKDALSNKSQRRTFGSGLLQEQDDEIEEKNMVKNDNTSSLRINDNSGGRRRRPWDFYYNLLLQYKEQHGHLRIPTSSVVEVAPFADGGTEDYGGSSGVNLGVWVSDQRVRLKPFLDADDSGIKAGTDLTRQVQIERLNAIGMLWDVRDVEWQEHFELLLAYKLEHGHSRIPWKYVTPNGVNLGEWVHNTRQRLKPFLDSNDRKVKKKVDISADGITAEQYHCRIHQLNEIGFLWDVRDVEWQEHFELLLAYNAEHGHLRIPQCYVTPTTGIHLGHWVNTQRQKLKPFVDDKQGKVKEDGVDRSKARERTARLNAIGFLWDIRDVTWQENFELVLTWWYVEHGHLPMPSRFVTPTGVKLGNWLNDQRRKLKPFLNTDGTVKAGTDKSRKWRIERLNEIGMVWEIMGASTQYRRRRR
jgi:Helicase associated domain